MNDKKNLNENLKQEQIEFLDAFPVNTTKTFNKIDKITLGYNWAIGTFFCNLIIILYEVILNVQPLIIFPLYILGIIIYFRLFTYMVIGINIYSLIKFFLFKRKQFPIRIILLYSLNIMVLIVFIFKYII